MNTALNVLHDQRPDLLVLRDEKQIMRAIDSLRSIGESRRKLLGIDARSRVAATVDLVNRKTLIEELNAELAAPGEEPVAVE